MQNLSGEKAAQCVASCINQPAGEIHKLNMNITFIQLKPTLFFHGKCNPY